MGPFGANSIAADMNEMDSSDLSSMGHGHRVEDLPTVDEDTTAEFLREESETYLEVGEFYLRNPKDLGTRVLINWFNEVAQSSPERRWGTLEMLSLYGLSAAEATGGFQFTPQEQAAIVASVAQDGALKEELKCAATDVMTLLRSGADPAAELPPDWATYTTSASDGHGTPSLMLTSGWPLPCGAWSPFVTPCAPSPQSDYFGS